VPPRGASRLQRLVVLSLLVFAALALGQSNEAWAAPPGKFGVATLLPRLSVWSSGKGVIRASPPAENVVDGTCERDIARYLGDNPDATSECVWEFMPGTRVTLRAKADADRTFFRWSLWNCPRTNRCTFTVRRDLSAVAIFAPAPLNVYPYPENTFQVRSSPPGIDCSNQGTPGCSALFWPSRRVTLTPSTTEVRWFAGCRPLAGDPENRCVTTSMNPFVCVDIPEACVDQWPPFQETADVRVSKGGRGRGTVSGSGLFCGTGCSQTYQWGELVRLRATAKPGSVFRRWRGVCGRGRVCRFSAGPVTSLRAVFRRQVAREALEGTADETLPQSFRLPR
jgi:Divergent InlB B-repeat domain